jgi:hypothetical protein
MRAWLVALVLISSTAQAARLPPVVDLYTMGIGDELFSAFGHAAICVTDNPSDKEAKGRCYNYGTADFSTPVPLTWNFIRGRAMFWVSVADTPAMLSYYQSVGRAVWKQRLALTNEQASRLAGALAASAQEGVKYYRYHHFEDNCTTRIRDVIDRASDGKLSQAPTDRGRTFRQWARAGFAGNVPLLVAVDLVLGRDADRRTDSWQAMFLPSELRAEVEQRLGAKSELVIAGRMRPPPGPTWFGSAAFLLGGAVLAMLIIFHLGAGRAFAGLVLGLVGTVLWALAALSSFHELRYNELLLIFWPTDLFLPWLRRRYVDLRLVVIALWLLAHLGLLVQPMAPALLVLLPMVAMRASLKRR